MDKFKVGDRVKTVGHMRAQMEPYGIGTIDAVQGDFISVKYESEDYHLTQVIHSSFLEHENKKVFTVGAEFFETPVIPVEWFATGGGGGGVPIPEGKPSPEFTGTLTGLYNCKIQRNNEKINSDFADLLRVSNTKIAEFKGENERLKEENEEVRSRNIALDDLNNRLMAVRGDPDNITLWGRPINDHLDMVKKLQAKADKLDEIKRFMETYGNCKCVSEIQERFFPIPEKPAASKPSTI